eukprot:353666-Chlamydomonas_euryale.AAC.4
MAAGGILTAEHLREAGAQGGRVGSGLRHRGRRRRRRRGAAACSLHPVIHCDRRRRAAPPGLKRPLAALPWLSAAMPRLQVAAEPSAPRTPGYRAYLIVGTANRAEGPCRL